MNKAKNNKTTRPNFKPSAIKALFAKSGNKCAFEDCSHELITKENLFVGQICHIEGFSKNGPRFNKNLNMEECRDFNNLILLCYKHHKIIDNDVSKYSVDLLKKIKSIHESRQSQDLIVNDELIRQIENEEKKFWYEIENINKNKHPLPGMAVNIDVELSVDEIFSKIRNYINNIEDLTDYLREEDSNLPSEIKEFLAKIEYNTKKYKKRYEKIPYYENPFEIRHWEWHNLAIPNTIINTRLLLQHLEIKYFELYIKKYPEDELVRIKLNALKEEMKEWATSCLHD